MSVSDIEYTRQVLINLQLISEWRLVPKQDHLVCFLGGSLLLGVTDGGRMKVPPDTSKFNERERADWTMGVKLIEGCMATHETTT